MGSSQSTSLKNAVAALIFFLSALLQTTFASTFPLTTTAATKAESLTPELLQHAPLFSFGLDMIRPYNGPGAVTCSANDTVETSVPAWLRFRAQDKTSTVVGTPTSSLTSSSEIMILSSESALTTVTALATSGSGITPMVSIMNSSIVSSISSQSNTSSESTISTFATAVINSPSSELTLGATTSISKAMNSTTPEISPSTTNSQSKPIASSSSVVQSSTGSRLTSTSTVQSTTAVQPSSISQTSLLERPSTVSRSISGALSTSTSRSNATTQPTSRLRTTSTNVSTTTAALTLTISSSVTSSTLVTSSASATPVITMSSTASSTSTSTTSSTSTASSSNPFISTITPALPSGSSTTAETNVPVPSKVTVTAWVTKTSTKISTKPSTTVQASSQGASASSTRPMPLPAKKQTPLPTTSETEDLTSQTDMPETVAQLTTYTLTASNSTSDLTQSSDSTSMITLTTTSFTTTTSWLTAVTSNRKNSSTSISNSSPMSNFSNPSDSAHSSETTVTTSSVTTYLSIVSSWTISNQTSNSVSESTKRPDTSSQPTPSTPSTTSSRSMTSSTENSTISLISATLSYTVITQTSISSPTTTTTSTSMTTARPHYRGLNIVNQGPDGVSWKSPTDWDEAFRKIKALPYDFNAVRLYSTLEDSNVTNADHLMEALPYARKYNLSVHAGIWSGGDNHRPRFENEKQALNDTLRRYGCDGIIAVSVGNEDMYNDYRNDSGHTPLTDPMFLVKQVEEVMDVLDAYGCCDVQITHTDTFGQWLNTSFSEPLIRQVDFLTVNIFPYWEGQSIDDATQAFWRQLNDTQNMAATYGKTVWIGETGWPVRGAAMGNAVPGIDNLRQYWRHVGCGLLSRMNAFWYVEWDSFASPSFGLTDANGNSLIGDLDCA